MKKLVPQVIVLLIVFACSQAECKDPPFSLKGDKICGLSFVAPPRPFTTDPMTPVKKVNAEWITVIPFAFTRPGEPKVYYNTTGYQWWGEKPEGIIETVKRAKEAGLKVMLKPQVYIPRGWVGDLDFPTDSEWQQWEAGYRDYIFELLEVAVEFEIEMICIGTEFRKHTRKREQFWRDLIKECRKYYSGLITYSANWDDYNNIPFWDELDYIGISAYFPLTESKHPTRIELLKAWQPVRKGLKKFAGKERKPVLFTEFGYLSVDGCAGKTWELEKKVRQLPVNEKAQAIALGALFEVFWEEPWWQGGFLWKWFPEMKGHEGYPERDYTPQGKIAQSTLTYWFGQEK